MNISYGLLIQVLAGSLRHLTHFHGNRTATWLYELEASTINVECVHLTVSIPLSRVMHTGVNYGGQQGRRNAGNFKWIWKTTWNQRRSWLLRLTPSQHKIIIIIVRRQLPSNLLVPFSSTISSCFPLMCFYRHGFGLSPHHIQSTLRGIFSNQRQLNSMSESLTSE